MTYTDTLKISQALLSIITLWIYFGKVLELYFLQYTSLDFPVQFSSAKKILLFNCVSLDGPNYIYNLHPEFLSLNSSTQWMYFLVRYYQLASTLDLKKHLAALTQHCSGGKSDACLYK